MNNDTASQFKVLPQFTKRHSDPVDHDGEWYGVIQGPEFAYDVFAPAAETEDGFREVLSSLAGNASLKAEVERLRVALTEVKNDLSNAAAPLFNKVPKVWDDLRQVHMKADHALSLVSESTT